MGYFFRYGCKFIVVVFALPVFHGVEFGLVYPRGDHGDVHKQEDLLEGWLLHVETGGAFEGHHLWQGFIALILHHFGLAQLDRHIDGLEGEDIGLEHQKIRSVNVDHHRRHHQSHAYYVPFRGVFYEEVHL